MLKINDIIGISIQTISLLLFLKILLNKEIKLISTKGILTFIFLFLITYVTYKETYNGVQTIISFLSIIIGIKILTDYSISKSFLIAGTYMVTLFLADLINLTIYVPFINISELRTNYFVLSNITSALITLIIINISHIRYLFKKIIDCGYNNRRIDIMTFISLSMIVLIMILYVISENYFFNRYYLLFIIVGILLSVLLLIYYKEKYEKEKLIDKYDHLFEYVQTFEDWIDTENINIHESKNQLATLRDIIKGNKKAENYIDTIINERINIENIYIENLKPIPKGGLKGLLYYKISLAKKNNINIEIDVSKKVSSILKQFEMQTTKDICRLLGIFLDNAIEASKDSNDKRIMLEIYLLKEDLYIVISNTFENHIELSKINQNGYTTKGKNRGKGLYLSQKISKQSKNITLKNEIINNYFVQKIKIKKEVN